MTDLIQVLRNYQKWMKDGFDSHGTPCPSTGDYQQWVKDGRGVPCPSISIEDIDGDETFGAAADEIERLTLELSGSRQRWQAALAEVERLRNPDPDYTLLKSFTFTEPR